MADEIIGLALFIILVLISGYIFSRFLNYLQSLFGKSKKTSQRGLTDLSPTEFEYKVGDYYEELGYDPLITRQSGDDGVDVIARNNGKAIAVQAKRYQTAYSVGSNAVENTHSAKQRIGADQAAVVTSSTFNGSAKQRANELNVELITGGEMAQVLNQSTEE